MDDAIAGPQGRDAFHAELAAAHMRGQWQNEQIRATGKGGVEEISKGVFGPKPGGAPHLWPWAQTRDFIERARDVVPESFTSRRAVMFNNPGLAIGTTSGVNMGVQSIKPGELAWAHRHSISALRFVIEGGPALTTVVDGVEYPMEPNDLVLTPAWRWHDHHNAANAHGIWLDVLDGPIVGALNQVFFETFGAERQPRDAGPLPAPENVLPARGNKQMCFPWRDAERQLRAATGALNPYDGVALEYCDPTTGAAIMPSLGCWLQMLRPGEATLAHRHTSSAVYFVINGSGVTKVGDVEMTWGPRDCFAIPNWSWHNHRNVSATDEAILFSVNDIPLVRQLGLYREEPTISLSRDIAPPLGGGFLRAP